MIGFGGRRPPWGGGGFTEPRPAAKKPAEAFVCGESVCGRDLLGPKQLWLRDVEARLTSPDERAFLHRALPTTRPPRDAAPRRGRGTQGSRELRDALDLLGGHAREAAAPVARYDDPATTYAEDEEPRDPVLSQRNEKGPHEQR